MTNAKFIKCITVTDPETHDKVELEIYKDEQSGIFAVNSLYLEQITDEISSPFHKGRIIKLIDRHEFITKSRMNQQRASLSD